MVTSDKYLYNSSYITFVISISPYTSKFLGNYASSSIFDLNVINKWKKYNNLVFINFMNKLNLFIYINN